ncbi:MAG: thiamine pyrophosphate-dependent enzyme [Methanomicrobiales archaeon]|nr:thiamine pyrophosphate-dependent enzyme [Methanomicrobiales archaeon]
MKGTDAVAQALLHCADRYYAVPGYPVTELAARIGAEAVINEKVGLEYALGDALQGRRAVCILKNVGLNACADPLVNATTQGVGAGVVIVAGDDIDVNASQNAQDSRYYGEIAQVPVLEPDPATCQASVEEAFRASERFSRVALLRLTLPLLNADVQGDPPVRSPLPAALAPRELTMRGRVAYADHHLAGMFAWSRSSLLNRLQGGTAGAGAAGGSSRVVTVYPPPPGLDRFTAIHELGRPFLREHRWILPPGTPTAPETYASRGHYRTFCPHCPFRAVMRILAERKHSVVCDIGCSLLAMNPPYGIGVASYGLGSSIAVAARSTGIALCGDYALLHSGINALADVREKRIPLLCIVLKNKRLGFVGAGQAYDIDPYIAWSAPLHISAQDETHLQEVLVSSDRMSVIVIEGVCPPGEKHETVEY